MWQKRSTRILYVHTPWDEAEYTYAKTYGSSVTRALDTVPWAVAESLSRFREHFCIRLPATVIICILKGSYFVELSLVFCTHQCCIVSSMSGHPHQCKLSVTSTTSQQLEA